ncbi:unnamed protein product [Sphagnum troendelagicum]|uniref:FHA domain-containing protein n=1 Tax=Sphagnum troendelagicum TaxID=128251 RepID=A0ABP0UCH1_9BRYO
MHTFVAGPSAQLSVSLVVVPRSPVIEVAATRRSSAVAGAAASAGSGSGSVVRIRRSAAIGRFGTKHVSSLGKPLRQLAGFRISALQASEKSVRWILDPVGDGDTSHLDEAVPMPGSFELVSDAATVGRVAEKADIVIPVATVSGLHARLEKRDGQLYVTDLDSTNGTYVDNKQIRPGAVTLVSPGSNITFGDSHLAVYQISRVESSDDEEVQS